MKVCPECQTRFSGNESFCPNDATPLVDARELSPGELTGLDLNGRIHLESLDFGDTLAERYQGHLRDAETALRVTVFNETFELEPSRVAEFDAQRAELGETVPAEILSLHSVDLNGDHRFIAEEAPSGISVTNTLEQRKTLEWKSAVRVVCAVGRALEYLSAHGVTYQGLSARSIFISDVKRGQIQLGDWGLNMLSHPKRPLEIDASASHAFFGYSAYLAPETIRDAADTDERSMVYSLGMLAYQLIVGKPPFTSKSEEDSLKRHLHEKPLKLSIACGGAGLHPDLDAILEMMWVKSPERRFQKIAAALAALSSLLDEGPDEVAPPLVAADNPVFEHPETTDAAAAAQTESDETTEAGESAETADDESQKKTMMGMPAVSLTPPDSDEASDDSLESEDSTSEQTKVNSGDAKAKEEVPSIIIDDSIHGENDDEDAPEETPSIIIDDPELRDATEAADQSDAAPDSDAGDASEKNEADAQNVDSEDDDDSGEEDTGASAESDDDAVADKDASQDNKTAEDKTDDDALDAAQGVDEDDSDSESNEADDVSDEDEDSDEKDAEKAKKKDADSKKKNSKNNQKKNAKDKKEKESAATSDEAAEDKSQKKELEIGFLETQNDGGGEFAETWFGADADSAWDQSQIQEHVEHSENRQKYITFGIIGAIVVAIVGFIVFAPTFQADSEDEQEAPAEESGQSQKEQRKIDALHSSFDQAIARDHLTDPRRGSAVSSLEKLKRYANKDDEYDATREKFVEKAMAAARKNEANNLNYAAELAGYAEQYSTDNPAIEAYAAKLQKRQRSGSAAPAADQNDASSDTSEDKSAEQDDSKATPPAPSSDKRAPKDSAKPSPPKRTLSKILAEAKAAERADKRNDAAKLYREAIAASPSRASAHAGLGNVLFDQAKYGDAVRSQKKAVQLAPSNNTYANDLGKTYYRLKQYKAAKKQWQNVLDRDPNNASAKRYVGLVNDKL